MKLSSTMKKLIIILGVLVSVIAAQIAFAQSEGIIIYEVKVNLHKTLAPDRQEMKNMMPEFRVSKDQLIFNNTSSLYKAVEEDEEDEEINDGQGMRMVIRRPENEIYVDQANSKRVLLQEFMGKKYLMEDSLRLSAWKFGAEVKDIKGFTCKQASFYNEARKQNVVAWYTDKLRPFLGPENFNTLPGAVLQVDINDGERVVTASVIEQRPLKKGEMKIPSGGTKTTEPEYQKMVKEQMERMGANGGAIIIRN
jgi:GLPGLI family protein